MNPTPSPCKYVRYYEAPELSEDAPKKIDIFCHLLKAKLEPRGKKIGVCGTCIFYAPKSDGDK